MESDRPAAESDRPDRWSWVRPTAEMVAPIALYYVLRAVDVPQLAALVLTAVPMIVLFLYQYAKTRVINELGLFMLVALVATSAVGLFSGSAQNTLVLQQSVGVAAGVALIVTTWARRPLTYTLTERIVEMAPAIGVKLHQPVWAGLWAGEPRFRRAWRVINFWLGFSQIVDAAVRVWMAYVLPVDSVPALGALAGIVISTLMVAVTAAYFALTGIWRMLRTAQPAGSTAELPLVRHARAGY